MIYSYNISYKIIWIYSLKSINPLHWGQIIFWKDKKKTSKYLRILMLCRALWLLGLCLPTVSRTEIHHTELTTQGWSQCVIFYILFGCHHAHDKHRTIMDYLNLPVCFIPHRIHVWDIPTFTIKTNQMWITIAVTVTWILWVIKLRSHFLLCAGNPVSSNAGKKQVATELLFGFQDPL